MTTVAVVCEGFLLKENGMVKEAHSTSTLILSDQIILVDTTSPAYRARLMDGLERRGVAPSDVDIVVSTHLHHDHVSNNDLFPQALFLARREEAPPPGYETVARDGEVAEKVSLMHTPGHTLGSMSVVVEAEDGRYVLAGDALPTRDNYEKWVPPGLNVGPELALASMRRIVETAEIIVPGHGPAFPTPKSAPAKR